MPQRNVILFDNVLTGDYERIDPREKTGNYAGGNPLVHIRAIPDGGQSGVALATPFPHTFYDRYMPPDARKIDRRQPLPSAFMARYIEGGPSGFLTDLTLGREGISINTREECAYAVN